jgi:homocysteine S-methyltransferase
MLGIIPLRSYKHAEFLHHEVPGMRIPERFREMMHGAEKNAAKLGVKLAQDFIKEAKSTVAGIYIMPPFRKYSVVDELLSVL